MYPDMVRQEMKAETLEGMAEYVGLKAMQMINNEKFSDITNDYICKLREQGSLLFDVRRMAYYSGTLYYLCCDYNKILYTMILSANRRRTNRIPLLLTV